MFAPCFNVNTFIYKYVLPLESLAIVIKKTCIALYERNETSQQYTIQTDSNLKFEFP